MVAGKWVFDFTYIMDEYGLYRGDGTIADEDSLFFFVENNSNPVLGDVNGDGEVSADDLTLLSRYVAGIEPVPEDDAVRAICDVTGNGEVDANDLTLLSRYVAGIITSLNE